MGSLNNYGKMTYKELLVLVVERQETTQKQLDDLADRLEGHITKICPANSKRISKLEGFRMWVLGAIALGGVVMTIALRLLL